MIVYIKKNVFLQPLTDEGKRPASLAQLVRASDC